MHICLFLLLPATVWAQVEKHVEVTKDYVPDLAPAVKLSFEPSMIDTAVLRPDIDYSITPQALAARLDVEPIRPATVTYWEFNRHRPLYLKLGAGWPFNTLGDLYVTTQHPGTGYLSGYANHEGIYADLRNRFGVETPAGRMLNRVGVAAGKYFGRRTLEGEVAYEHRRYRRYGGIDVPGAHVPVIGYGEMGVGVRFGDDFRDLSRASMRRSHGASTAICSASRSATSTAPARSRSPTTVRTCLPRRPATATGAGRSISNSAPITATTSVRTPPADTT